MRKIFSVFAAAAIASTMTIGSQAAYAADATASASAVVVAPIAITKASDLEFGTFAPSATLAGAVAIDASGNRTNPDTNLSLLAGATPSQAQFTITGGNSATFAITVPATTVLNDGGANNMTATLTSDLGTTGTLDGTGNATLNVSASLAVASGQAAGSYTGSFDVTVLYN